MYALEAMAFGLDAVTLVLTRIFQDVVAHLLRL